MTMNKTLIKNYSALYPSIDLSKGFLNFEDKATILINKLPNLNLKSDSIKTHISKLSSEIRSSQKLFREFMVMIGNGNAGSSTATIEYWLKMGWDEETAKIRITEEQKRRSKRCVEYWISKGFSLEDAKEKVSIEQSLCAKKWIKGVSKPKSMLQIQFWLNRGFSLDEAISIISERQKENSIKAYKKYSSEELKAFKPVCLEYWKKRYPDDYEKMYENYLGERYKNTHLYRSKIADEFCDELRKHFEGCKIFCKDTEYGRYIQGVGYRKYDYIDTTNMVCVEFHGDYWHEENDTKDLIKKEFIESLGFRYFVVWESDYRKNKSGSINQLLEKINA